MFGRGGEKPTQQALLMGAMESPSATAVDTKPSVSFNPIAAELGALRALARLGRGRLALILIGAALFAAALAFAIQFLIAKDTNAARHGANAFATAVVHDDPRAAPQGAEEYVSGVRRYFGDVSSASIYRTHNHGVNTGNTADTRTYIVADMLLESKRGPAVLEIDFDNGSIGSDRVSSIRELDPKHAPGLNSAQRQRIEAAFAKRGGKVADTVTLLEAPASPSAPAPVKAAPAPASRPVHHLRVHVSPPANAALTKAAKQLKCVQAAHGDVTKMQRCTQS
jgi:hypothetical protein